MDAEPVLTKIAAALARNHLEAVLIGNSGAAVHGAPVTTLDFDFMFRSTPSNLKKLNRIAEELEARLYVPYELSGMLRLQNEDYRLLIDFLPSIAGVRSFEGLRKRAKRVRFGKADLLVADLADIIKSKKAAGRPRDLAVLPILEKVLEEATREQKGPPGSSQERE